MKNHSEIDKLRRREFMKIGALLASSMMLPNLGYPQKQNVKEDWPLMAHNYLTPFLLMDCVSRLGQGSGFIHASLKHCISPDIRFIVPGNAFRIGGLAPFSRQEIMASLNDFKATWNSGSQNQAKSQQLALLAGGLCHGGILNELKKADHFQEVSPSGNLEHRIYQDGKVIREYLTSGNQMGLEEEKDLHGLFREMIPRTLVRFHTIMPDDEDAAGWVRKTAKWREQTDLYFGELATAIANPDDGKLEKYIKSPSFFDGSEPIIQRVSYFAKISELNTKEAERLISRSADGSVFGKALAKGYQMLMDLNDYLSGEQSMESWQAKI
jgi:hypothetical protein